MSWEIIVTILGTILGSQTVTEIVRWFRHKKTDNRIAEAKADASEFTVLRDTIIFLETQLKEKEERFAQQTDLVRKLNSENLNLTSENVMLKTERGLKLCERRNCGQREPQSGY